MVVRVTASETNAINFGFKKERPDLIGKVFPFFREATIGIE
jgi:hypothetical protein